MVNIFFKLLARHNSSWQKKKEQEIFRSRSWACIFRVKWYTVGMHNAMTRTGLETNSSWDVSRGKEKVPLLQWICWVQKSGLIFFLFFHVCYHAGSSTKHMCRPEVRRHHEESSPSDLTPEKRKTCLAGKTRTYLWVCPLTPTPRPHFSSPLPLQNKNS